MSTRQFIANPGRGPVGKPLELAEAKQIGEAHAFDRMVLAGQSSGDDEVFIAGWTRTGDDQDFTDGIVTAISDALHPDVRDAWRACWKQVTMALDLPIYADPEEVCDVIEKLKR